jgi:hypothetical protein
LEGGCEGCESRLSDLAVELIDTFKVCKYPNMAKALSPINVSPLCHQYLPAVGSPVSGDFVRLISQVPIVPLKLRGAAGCNVQRAPF